MKSHTNSPLKNTDEIIKTRRYALIGAVLWTLTLSGLFIAHVFDARHIPQALIKGTLQEALFLSFIWLVGLGFIWFGTQKIIRAMTLLLNEQKMLYESKERYRELFNGAGDGIFILSTDGKMIVVNESMARMHGYSTMEMEKMNLQDLDTPETFRSVPDRMQRLFAGEPLTFEVEHYHKDGHIFPLEVSANLITSGGESYLQCFHRDITDRKKAEEERQTLEQQFYQAQKLESLGVLASGIAHDFNNILTVILGYCYMAKDELSSEQEYKTAFQLIENAGNRAADLCWQMLTYAGKSPLVQTSVNLWLLIDEVVKILQAAIRKNVTIKLDLKPDVPEIVGDTGQLQQIVMNLIINAAEAIGEANGTITLVLKNIVFEVDQTETDTFGTIILAGKYACIEVTDTGSGMDEETKTRIFEPFYTTKVSGRGLGMSAIRGIVKAHEGILHLTSTQGVGTTFKILFHVPETYDYEEVVAATPVPSKKASGTILLIDDELTLRDMGIEVLNSMGFSVLTAEHGREALEIFNKRSSEIDIIILDLIMPVMGGIEAYHELRKIAPTIPVIICSGYGVNSVEEIIQNDQHTRFVHKPYNPVELRDTILRMNDEQNVTR